MFSGFTILIVFGFQGNQCGVHCFLPNAVPTVNGHSNKLRGRLASITDPEQDQEAVVKVTCTALLEWTPDPETIICKVGCNKVRNV